MARLKRMDQIKLIIATYLETDSIKATHRRLGISKNTVRNYIRKAKEAWSSLEAVSVMSNTELGKVFYKEKSVAESLRGAVFDERAIYWIKELPRVGVTRQLLWEEYIQEYKDGYQYSQFCDRLNRSIKSKNLTLALNHPPGRVMQIDFCGKTLNWVNEQTGEVHRCQILVLVMPYSQYTFAIALPSQKVEDFVYGINQALLFFSKKPTILLCDNLKSFVIKANKYEPTFNELCVQLAAHYQVELQATRVRHPKDKASVENMVKTVYTRIFAPMRNEIYHNIEALNEGILVHLERHNSKPYQKREGCRTLLFKDQELPEMQELPNEIFEIKKTTKAKVQKNYHVFLGEEKNYYSVPYRFVGKQAVLIYTRKTVEIYVDNQRVAIHKRLDCYAKYRYQTNADHPPTNHKQWLESAGYNEAYFLNWANKIGPATRWVIEYILRRRIYQSQSYQSCQGVLSLAKKYTTQRLELACEKCQKVDKVNFGMLDNILKKNLDQHPQNPDLFTQQLPDHENTRGSKNYH